MTLCHPNMHLHTKFGIPISKNIGICTRINAVSINKVRGKVQGHSDPIMVHDTSLSQDASTHQIWNSYLKEYRRYAPDTKRDGWTDGHFINRSEVKAKVTVTRKWYATLRHPKLHPHTKFGIPISKSIGDMHRTRSWTDGRTVRLLFASQSSFGGIKKPNNLFFS